MLEAVINFHIRVDFFTLPYCSYNFIELTFWAFAIILGSDSKFESTYHDSYLKKSMLLPMAGIIIVWEITSSSATVHIIIMN